MSIPTNGTNMPAQRRVCAPGFTAAKCALFSRSNVRPLSPLAPRCWFRSTKRKRSPSLRPKPAQRLHSVPNGVDLEFFTPDRVYPNPFSANEMPIVMTGTMDYRPNAEGAILVCAKRIAADPRRTARSARFYVVGARPSAQRQIACRIECRDHGQSGAMCVPISPMRAR